MPEEKKFRFPRKIGAIAKKKKEEDPKKKELERVKELLGPKESTLSKALKSAIKRKKKEKK